MPLRTNYEKAKVDNTQQNRLCGEREETVNQKENEPRKLASKEYKTRHKWLGNVIHWELGKILKVDKINCSQTKVRLRERDINFPGILRYKRIT